MAGNASAIEVQSPDGRLKVDVNVAGKATYQVTYDDVCVLQPSDLGLVGNFTDFSKGLTLTSHDLDQVSDSYSMNRTKFSHHDYNANRLVCHMKNEKGHLIDLEMQVDNNNIAFRYLLPKDSETGSIRVMEEETSYNFPSTTTAFLTPQSFAMVGWKRTKPSYEEDYVYDAPMTERSAFGKGWTFPCLFKVNCGTQQVKKGGKKVTEEKNIWVLVSETGVDSRYCGSRLSDYNPERGYTVTFPMPEECNGNGSVEPIFALPGATPWRTITVGNTLKPIVETTIHQDVVAERYEASTDYKFGKGTWSWIVWQDNSINVPDLKKYIDLCAGMGYQYVLVDNWWDTNFGKEGVLQLVDYAKLRGVELFLWYSSSGYWNDIVQGPINKMDNSIIRKREMKWMKEHGIKGIKVDFFAGDKQETMRLYEEILSDANDYGLMVIFHGCTIPRGWERMYPNYVGSEAVLASENIYFMQKHCDIEAMNICTHPFIRNAQGCMEFGGCFMNRRIHREPNKGNIRRTTDVAELATCVLFQNPIQNFALTPNNLWDYKSAETPDPANYTGDAPKECIDFLREVPTTWDETRFVDGYPGKYVVMARRKGTKWYIAAVNAQVAPLKLELDLTQFGLDASQVQMISGGNAPVVSTPKAKKNIVKLVINNNDAVVMHN